MFPLHHEIVTKDGVPESVVLPYDEFRQLVQALQQLEGGLPASDPRYGGFWDNLSAEELTRRKGVKPVERIEDLYGNGDPADWEGFDGALEQWRSGHQLP